MVDLEPGLRTGLNVSSFFPPSPPSLRIGAKVGRGYFATVHEGELDGQPVAVKKLYRHKEERFEHHVRFYIERFERECRLLERLKHPNIIGFSGAFYDVKSKEPVLVMEMLKEKLRDFVNREGKLSLLRQLKLCLGLASGLEYLHSRSPPVVHRDLTDENVMLSEEGVVKIIDFGIARLDEEVDAEDIYDYCIGYYLAPEINSNIHHTVKFDVFSLGVWMLGISKGYCPPGERDMLNYSEISPEHAEAMSSLDDGHLLKPFILQCMKEDPKERPSAAAVHSFIESQVVSCM